MDKYTCTTPTIDSDAQTVNQLLNDVNRMIFVGKQLLRILDERFAGDERAFRRWVNRNLDCATLSAFRYMTLAENENRIGGRGMIRLCDAYRLLGIDGNLSVEVSTN